MQENLTAKGMMMTPLICLSISKKNGFLPRKNVILSRDLNALFVYRAGCDARHTMSLQL